MLSTEGPTLSVLLDFLKIIPCGTATFPRNLFSACPPHWLTEPVWQVDEGEGEGKKLRKKSPILFTFPLSPQPFLMPVGFKFMPG